MNSTLSKFARDTLKANLALCTDGERHVFELMYCPRTGRRGENPVLGLSTDEIVDKMPDEKLDWAMQQVERTLAKATIRLAREVLR